MSASRMKPVGLSKVKCYVGKPDLVLAGDGRCDSPGHSAIFGTCSLMDVDTNLVLASNVVKVTEVKNSHNMENEGLIRSFADLLYDVWHLGKSLGKKLTKAANRKDCADLQPWVKSIKNHLWWCAGTCDGDVTQPKERWMSILRHIVNKHEWHVASMYTVGNADPR
ncbi:hypothetical protein LOTGIDRAFT_161023 [Lottia gigantea]|uniref:Uncharacterized protein n=1 Tax=Lottia gigantea TaxID=225164 RepID=V3ZTI4_LOTGI|nr:hypothetical protein LOTGIDRAFT_161023 [Lottia gigantea]ESO94773.1 hypothetical protein LOTGIDRAFT_161023 [Lottia gigantea]